MPSHALFQQMNEACLSCEWVKCKKFGTYNKYFSFKVIYWQSRSLLPVTCSSYFFRLDS